MRLQLLTLSFLIIVISPLYSAKMNLSVGVYGGVAPSLGGDMQSAVQISEFQSRNGLDGMNRDKDGYDTSSINKLLGVSGGIALKAVFLDYFLLKLGGNYTRGVYGGKGTTVYFDSGASSYMLLDCSYKFYEYDAPLTLGISIPIGKEVRISLSCGIAYAYAKYTNSFSSDTKRYRGSFSEWDLPLVYQLEGEYFINDKFAISTMITYYRGSSNIIRDGTSSDGNVDLAKVNYTGFRYYIGAIYSFLNI